MTKTVLMGHFYKVYVKEGQTINQGDHIGLMGNTGVSYGEHVHLAVADSAQTDRWWLGESLTKKVSKKATEDFLNSGTLFEVDGKSYKNLVTTEWLGYGDHYACDLIADKAPKLPDVVWPMDKPGKVVQVKDDGDKRYGRVVLVQYDFEDKPTLGQKIVYEVKAGDTLTWIAKRHNTTVQKIAEDNRIENPNFIYIGQKIQILPGQAQGFRVGDRVRVRGSHYATGEAVPQWVKDGVHTISELDDEKALLGHPNGINSWVKLRDLNKA